MDEIDSFLVKKKWLEKIDKLPTEQQDKIIADFVRYGVGLDLKYTEDEYVSSMVNFIKDNIDFSKDAYARKVEAGLTRGKKKTIDDLAIWELAHHKNMRSQDIADSLGISKSAVDHSDGWRRRKDECLYDF